ncbi:asparagine synthase-related protein [Asticcacaulis sp. DXS10W]|uniref:asparagine synthase (glutamine-hydrolyzing) n=1 Tax=Asticcacaulis currens TaxID=2984210 RepID=A0ABT5I9B4_9CAUL|nr:asparagine synthase-related protein [Asticcacaulis currens]MDC7692778.1 asparagine synthase-related protein [Asticcacaulis currens]
MTGVTAAITSDPAKSRDTVDQLLFEMRHRARSGFAQLSWMETAFGLAHTPRLPEDDAEASIFESPAWIVAADARLDNRDELIARLLPEEAIVSDAHLVFCALSQWGEAAPKHLRGDFAFVALHKTSHTLFAARDPFGVRPLYYRTCNQDIALASEAGALISNGTLAAPLSRSDVRIKQTLSYLTGTGSSEAELEFRNLFRVKPGHLLIWKSGKARQSAYFELKPANVPSDIDWVAEFRRRFEAAVQSRLRSREPVAALLSGGLDSSSIVAVAARQSHRPLRIVAGTFPAYKKGDEQPYINAVMKYAGGDCIKVKLDKLSPINAAQSVIRDLKRPFNAPGIAVLNALAPVLADNRKGFYLDGHGGDEVVSYGFNRVLCLARNHKWGALWRELPAWSGLFGTNRLLDFLRLFLRFSEIPGTYRIRRTLLRLANKPLSIGVGLLKRQFIPMLPPQSAAPRTNLERHTQSIQNGLLAESFELYDVVAARHGLQPLFPFFDQELVELCLAVPDEVKLKHGYSRYILREAMKDYLPESVRWRRSKFDFSTILIARLKGWHDRSNLKLATYYRSPLLKFLSKKKLRVFLQKSVRTDRLDGASAQTLWRLITLDYWLKICEK